MNLDEAIVVHGSGKQRIRPSNWIARLIDLVAAHWEGQAEPRPYGTCCQCPDTTCFVFPVSLHKTHPGLVLDVLFCLRMLEVPDLTAKCPRNIGGSGFNCHDAVVDTRHHVPSELSFAIFTSKDFAVLRSLDQSVVSRR